jgi:hypothetical protein
VILAYAGRRAQSIPGDSERVAERVSRLLEDQQPSTIVGAAADGGDLLVLEAALATPNPPDIHVLLPTPREVFREDSVETNWRDRVEAALREERRGGIVETLALEPGEMAHRHGSKRSWTGRQPSPAPNSGRCYW